MTARGNNRRRDDIVISICKCVICGTLSHHKWQLLVVVMSGSQGGHGTGKTGNLAVSSSRHGKHGEFSKFNFLHRENFVIEVTTR